MLLTPEKAFELFILIIAIMVVVYLIAIHPLKKMMREQQVMIQLLLNKTNLSAYKMYDVAKDVSDVNNNLASLTSSFETMVSKEEEKEKKKIFPDHALAKEIRDVIHDELSIEVILNKDNKIPISGILERVIQNTLQVYPNVDEEWLARRVIAIMEETTLNANSE